MGHGSEYFEAIKEKWFSKTPDRMCAKCPDTGMTGLVVSIRMDHKPSGLVSVEVDRVCVSCGYSWTEQLGFRDF